MATRLGLEISIKPKAKRLDCVGLSWITLCKINRNTSGSDFQRFGIAIRRGKFSALSVPLESNFRVYSQSTGKVAESFLILLCFISAVAEKRNKRKKRIKRKKATGIIPLISLFSLISQFADPKYYPPTLPESVTFPPGFATVFCSSFSGVISDSQHTQCGHKLTLVTPCGWRVALPPRPLKSKDKKTIQHEPLKFVACPLFV